MNDLNLPEFFNVFWPIAFAIFGMIFIFWSSGKFLHKKDREIFLALFFVGSIALALVMIFSDEWQPLISVFMLLRKSTKYAIGLLIASFAYFSMYFIQFFKLSNENHTNYVGKNSIASKKPQFQSYPKNLDWENDKMGSFIGMTDFLIDEILADLKENYEAIPEQIKWIHDMLHYNVKGGKMIRGLGVIDVHKAFAISAGKKLEYDEYCKACVLGVCIEWLQAFFLVADDVMDESLTRRGQPCWYKLPHVKIIAVNDSFILQSLVYRIIALHFSHEPFYLKLIELFNDVIYQTELGQLLDLTSQPMDAPSDFSRFTTVRYSLIVKYKTAFYTFYLPCAIGMLSAGVSDLRSYDLAKRICCVIGEYFQVQDDFLDCFGDPSVIGKIGTDIQDKKCSWLVVQALSKCSDSQRNQLMENYGQNDLVKVEKVKEIYRELNLSQVFATYEERSYKTIQALIAEVNDVPRDVFNNFVQRIYKRKM
mmetsp:Transcript_4108/g.6270  ORF Transcript_4108/g.6270 Transcript_4108/m.6270 type:complete len:479 (-) Transcript_4108:8-1444(-)